MKTIREELTAALERMLDECPYHCDTDECECGENGDGFDDAGQPCEHIQARRALARAKQTQRKVYLCGVCGKNAVDAEEGFDTCCNCVYVRKAK